VTETETRAEPAAETAKDPVASHAAFELLWSKVLESWDDDKVHTAFLELARATLMLPEAGARYRAIKENDPERAAVAEQKLAQLMVLALAMLQSARESFPQGPPRWVTSVVCAVVAVFVAVLIRKVFVGP